MPGLFHVKTRLVATSGNPKDDCSNSFSFISTSSDTDIGDAQTIVALIEDFHNEVPEVGLEPVAAFLGPSLSRSPGDAIVKVYGPLVESQMGGPLKDEDGEPVPGTQLGSPLWTDTFTLGGPVPTAEADRQSSFDLVLRANGWLTALVETPDGPDVGTLVDRPKQRLTGRVKLGPVDRSAGFTSDDETWRPNGQIRDTVTQAADALVDAGNATDIQLAVWSRVNRAFVSVSHVQVDNRWGSVNKRKPAGSSRTTLVVNT